MEPFLTPVIDLVRASEDGINSLSDLVDYHVKRNPDYPFCVQATRKLGEDGYSLASITYRILGGAVSRCVSWIEMHVATNPVDTASVGEGGGTRPPVALLMDSDLGLAVHILSLMAMGVPMVLLSSRLSPTAAWHLIQRAGATTALVSERLRPILSEANAIVTDQGGPDLSMGTQIITAVSYKHFMDGAEPALDEEPVRFRPRAASADKVPAVILHSSGTSGLPKPINCFQRYFLGFSQCHDFRTPAECQALALSTSPFFHVR